jgi:hypothetical protein
MEKVFERSYCYIKLCFFIFSMIYFGFMKTTVFFALHLILRRYFMKFVFGLQELNSTSQTGYSEKAHQRANLMGVILVENIDADKIKNVIIKRGIEQIPKLRSKLVKKFFNLYWKEVPLSEAYERIKIIEKPFENEQEFMEYASKQSGNIIDFNELLYFIEIATYKDKSNSISKGGIIFLFDHILSDGLGMVALMCAMADNFKPEIFPPIMKRETNTISYFITNVSHEILSLIYIPYILYRIKSLKLASAPYMNAQRPLGQIKHTISKAYNLKDFDNIRKHKLKISFNDMIITVISKSINQICKDMGKSDITNFLTFVPVGKHKLPTSVKEVILDNQVSAVLIDIPAVKDTLKDCKHVAKTFYKQLTNFPVIKAMFKFDAFFAEFMRREDMQDESEKLINTLDFVTSNVPGPVEELYYDGCKLTSMFGLPNVRRLRLFIPIISYNKQFRIICAVNECIDFDVELFLKYFDENLNELLNNNHLD